MRSLWSLPSPRNAVLALLVVAGGAWADTPEQAKAKSAAALALAKAKRERETKAKADVLPYHTDYAAALKEAERSGKHLVLWVGMTCEERPALRKELAGAVHCHLATFDGDRTPRVVIRGGDGINYAWLRSAIDVRTAARIRDQWDRRPRAAIREETTTPAAQAPVPVEIYRIVQDCPPPPARPAGYAGWQFAAGVQVSGGAVP